MAGFFVDAHSHIVPSGDDGVQSVGEAAALCREAHRLGTRLLFCTPHVFPHLPLSAQREDRIRANLAQLRPQAKLEVRLGFELTPAPELLDQDPRRYLLEGTDRVLMEVPFEGDADLLFALAEYVQDEGLMPVIAHPERTESVQQRPALADELAERGWQVQVNASSLTNRHGPAAARIGWDLVERGRAALVASDGHRLGRPPFLDAAWQLAVERVGEEPARRLFDGSALGLAAVAAVDVAAMERARPLPSRAMPPAA